MLCRFVGFLRNLAKVMIGHYCTRVCRAFQKFEIFLLDAALRVAKRKIFYWSTSKFIFSETNRKILRTRHTLEAYKVLIDTVQFG